MKKLSALLFTGLTACSSSAALDPGEWTCQSLIQPIIKMSEGRTPAILELTNAEEIDRIEGGSTPSIQCKARAEWSEGYGLAEYGAHVSNGGGVILEYRQK